MLPLLALLYLLLVMCKVGLSGIEWEKVGLSA